LENFTLEGLTARLERTAPGVLGVHLTGKSASREAGRVLAPLFDETLGASKVEERMIELHFEKLEYFNSSTIAALVQFIRAAQVAGVPMRIVYDGTQKWQALSFDALKRAMKPFESGTGPTVHFVCPND
jgi:hypothetical protein